MSTIFAVSSGRPPAAIAIVRISGDRAIAAATKLAGSLPPPRQAGLRSLRDAGGQLLDRVLLLVFPGPDSATGEDLVELHCHGGRSVVAAVLDALSAMPGLREAEPGEFTRRALISGRIDLAEAQGLGDLLSAETELQRRAAIAVAEGQVSRAVKGWLARVSDLSAQVEARLDFADEGDVIAQADETDRLTTDLVALREDIEAVLARPPVDRLRDGIRVVIGGPPNSGKSTLINRLVAREVAIVSPISGTTRDRIEASVSRRGVPYVVTDTAGLTNADDPIERIGVDRAEAAIREADILVWMADDPPPRNAIWVHARADAEGRSNVPGDRDVAVALGDDSSVDRLWDLIDTRATSLIPEGDALALDRAQIALCAVAVRHLAEAEHQDDIVRSEGLRLAARSLAAVLGVNATEEMLDALFGRFCLGK